MSPLWLLAGLLLLLGLLVLGLTGWLRHRTRLPAGRLLTSDAGARPGQLLHSTRYQLHGRPDYLVRQGQAVIPVELKPGQRRAYDSAIGQLMAYCLLVEEHFGRPPYGLLVLRDGVERIDYSDARRAELLATLAAMRQLATLPLPNHQQPARCRACSLRPLCTAALTD